ncbi:hypothetical protein ACSV5M_04750 [Cellvibrio sp. ARAG 10.3]|uniref:hypothetical protein n=1 Tax=Cellvibrio sp. ARAG 10.3 TaxID=3451358 RepID=UPI003F470C6C
MTKRVAEISELIGAWKAVNHGDLVPELRRGNRIRTSQASLAVEQNTLSLEQVTAVLEGKAVLGLPREIRKSAMRLRLMKSWSNGSLNKWRRLLPNNTLHKPQKRG